MRTSLKMLWGVRRTWDSQRRSRTDGAPHAKAERSQPIHHAFYQNSTIIAVIEMSLSSWLIVGVVPGIERHPLKKLEVDEDALLKLLLRWRDEAVKAGRKIERIAVAFEAAGMDFGWRVGSWRAAPKPTSSIQQASRSPVNTGALKPTASTPGC
jgi:transposase